MRCWLTALSVHASIHSPPWCYSSRKKDGSWQFYVDYKALNAVTIKDHFLIPTVDELLDELANAAIVSKFRGFHRSRQDLGNSRLVSSNNPSKLVWIPWSHRLLSALCLPLHQARYTTLWSPPKKLLCLDSNNFWSFQQLERGPHANSSPSVTQF